MTKQDIRERIEHLNNQIFYIMMQDRMFAKDWEQVAKYEKEIAQLEKQL